MAFFQPRGGPHPREKSGKNLVDLSLHNPAAVHILEKNPDKLVGATLSSNPAAIHLLQANPDKINWRYLSGNHAAIHLLEQNQDKINWDILSQNPAIFEYDYTNMTCPFKEELLATIYHPDNISKFREWF